MKKSLIVVLSSVTLLTSCNIGQNSNSSFKIDEIEIVDKVMDKLDLLKSSEVNYTLNVIDYGGDFSLSFSSGVYTYKELDSGKMEGYIEDDNGIYGFNISRDGVFSTDYYEVDDDGKNLHSLYNNLYTFKDVDIDYENIYDEDDRVYFSNLNNDYCKILFSLAGYSVDSTYSGMSYNDVESMYFTIDSNSNLQLAVAFNESTSGRGTTIMTVENIGSTVQDQKIIEYIGTNNGGKVRVGEGSSLFKYLGYLKNMRNFTLNVRSDYKTEGLTNYTMTSKYMKDAYYSYTNRKDEDDIGLIVSDGVVKNMLYNDVTNKITVGSVYTDNKGNSFKDIYNVVNSFIDLDWEDEKTFKAREIDGGKFVIEEKNLNAYSDFLSEIFSIFNETILRFQLLDYTFWYDENHKSYHFIADLVDDDKIYLDITDINKTTIGDHTNI